jgi:ATP-dependent Lon protease
MPAAAKNKKKNKIPETLPLISLRDTVIFPYMIFPLFVGRERSIKALETAYLQNKLIVLAAQKDAKIEVPTRDDIYSIGTVSTIMQVLKLADGTVKALVEGISRVKIKDYLKEEPYFEVLIEEIPEPEVSKKDLKIEALKRAVISKFEQCVKTGKPISPDAFVSAINIEEPGRLADLIAFHISLKLEERQEILETIDPEERLKRINSYLTRELEILEIEGKIQSEVKKEIEKTQREFFLRKQMEAIQKELGEMDEHMLEIQEFKEKIEKSGMPEEVKEKALREVDRLAKMPSAAAEAVVVRTYLDWLTSLPWDKKTEDNLDIKQAAKILDEDHYGLKKVKERILEYLAIRQLTERMKSPILCFVGPPGVGKTSLGRSIARALGRKFVRMSLGGIRDEAEIRGHRRTYIGALPGRIIQGMRNAGTINPVFMLDEIDKIGIDFRGDPSAALLEVLDPEQNDKFSDHYLDVPYNLSQVFFITTANILDPIPPALKDRMEIIELPGYIEEEKVKIAELFLIPKQLEAHGLKKENLEIEENAIKKIIREYTREAGVRNLEREIAAICRKVGRKVVEGNNEKIVIDENKLHEYLGPIKYYYGMAEEKDDIGVATGLAWTEFGGDILSVESTIMEGKGNLILTGHLGEVMQESAKAAVSFIRSRAKKLGIEKKIFEKNDIHIHVPAGAIPKDGPSAGITIAISLVSLLTQKPVKRDIAMTGEITLRGRILPVGGIKEKILSAHRAGIKTVILPKKNEKDLEEIPQNVLKELNFIFIENIDEAIEKVFV